MLYKTDEIKSGLVKKFQNDHHKMLMFYIKDNNYLKFREILEKYKIEINTKDEHGNSLLSLAVQCNSYEIAKYLLELDAEVNTQNVFYTLILD